MVKIDLASQAYKRDPFPTLAGLVEQGPIVAWKMPLLGSIGLVTRYDAALDLLKHKDDFAVDGRNAGLKSQFGLPWLPRTVRLLGENMLSYDDPAHRRLRQLADAPLKAHAIDRLRPAIAAIADELLDEVEASESPDLVAGFCRTFPLAVICELLGLPQADRPRFIQWMETPSNVRSALGVFRVVPALKRIMNYLRDQIALRRDDPQPGLITELVQAEAEGDRLSENELVAMILMLFIAGHETTTHLLSVTMETLLRHPDRLDQAKAAPELWPAIVEESLRYNSPVQMTKPRYARRDMDFHGVEIKRGQRFAALIASANVDPDRFDHPHVFDPDRATIRHLGFGGGMHLCLGLSLARAEAQIGLERVFARWPDLPLAVGVDDLRWAPRLGARGLAALPLALERVAVAA